MPYSVVQGGGDCGDTQWAVLNKDSGRTMGCHASKQEAVDQQSALYVHAEDDDDGGTDRAYAAPQTQRKRVMAARNVSTSERGMSHRHHATAPRHTIRQYRS